MQIRVTGRREGAVAILEVSDTGPGVPQRSREHLFEAFQTSGRPGGSGLGLAIAAELARAHDGEIHLVEGTIGATFRIVIPDRPVELLSVRNERQRLKLPSFLSFRGGASKTRTGIPRYGLMIFRVRCCASRRIDPKWAFRTLPIRAGAGS